MIKLKHIIFNTTNTCARQIEFDLNDNKIFNLKFYGGCNGNLKAIAKLLEGEDALQTANKLQNNVCGGKNTSCCDQLSKAIYEALNE